MLLIKDIATLKKLVGSVQKSTNFDTWEAYIDQAQNTYITPAFGDEFIGQLASIVSPTGDTAVLIKKLQLAVAHYAYAMGLPQAVTIWGDAGAASPSLPNTQTMPKWMFVQNVKSAMAKGDNFLEDALVYLEANPDEFETWVVSDLRTITKQDFISSATELTANFAAARNSRRLFLNVRPYLRESETNYLEYVIGTPFFNDLKAKLIDIEYEFTTEEKIALRLIRQTIANRAVADALPFINLNADFRIVSETDGIVNEDELTPLAKSELKQKIEDDCEMYRNRLKAYLDTTASETVLEDYFSSATYTASSTNKTYIRKPNDPAQPFFRM